ncbi:hypothetical protein BASH2_04889 [Bacillus anthracis]|nr:hypothetical protein BASH2_04889 [Bacillus anthracis]
MKEIQMNPPIAAIVIIPPPTFALLFTITDPTIPKIDKATAAQPKPITLLAPSASIAEATPPINKAINAHKIPKIPPISPNTNSVVRFILNLLSFLYFIPICALLVASFCPSFSVKVTLKFAPRSPLTFFVQLAIIILISPAWDSALLSGSPNFATTSSYFSPPAPVKESPTLIASTSAAVIFFLLSLFSLFSFFASCFGSSFFSLEASLVESPHATKLKATALPKTNIPSFFNILISSY